MQILFVDDENDLLDQAKIFLERIGEGIEVSTSPSAEKALDMMDEKDFDVIVSDYQMPGMNGLEFLEEIREIRESDVPFIVFTGKGREEVAMEALNLGADRYMQKGGDPRSQYHLLYQAIEQEYKHHRTKEEREKYTSELEFLNDLILKVSRIKSPDEICQYIAEKVHSLDEDDYVAVALYDHEEETIRIRAVEGFDDYPQLVEELMHPGEEVTFDPDIQEEWSDIYSSGNLELMPEGLYSLVKGVLSKEKAADIEDLLGVEEVYSVGFALEGKPYGGITILKTSEEGVKFSSAIETIASHLSVTLQRRQFKEKFRESREELKESEEKYRRLFETAQDGMLIIDAETGIIEEANPFLQDMLGYSKGEVIGRELWELGTFKSVVENKKRFEELTEEGYIRYEDMPLETKDGEKVPVEFVSNTYEAGGKEVVQCNIREISKREETKEELKRKERYLDHTPAFINVINEEGEIEYHSYPSNEVTGLDPNKFMGSEALEFAHPDDREDAMEMFSKVLENPGEEYSTELRGKVEDGWIWLEVRAVNHLDDPTINGIIVSAQDISDRKKAEQRIEKNKDRVKRLHEISAELQTYDSEDDVYSFVIKAAEDILDFDLCVINVPEGDVMKAAAISSEFPKSASSTDKPLPIDDSLAGKTYLEKRSFLVRNKDENEHINPTSDDFESGISVPVGEYGVFQAVSTEPEHFTEEDLQTAELLMSHVSEALDRIQMKKREEFLHSLLRHDVGNKNQMIRGYLELMRDHDLPDEVKTLVDKAEDASKANEDMIEKIRNLRDIEEEEEIGEMEIDPIIEKASSKHRGQLREHGIDLDFSGCGCVVRGGSLLEELFSNLIENSILHSDCGEIKIYSEIEDDECVVTVEDDGSGISDEIKDEIFGKGFKSGEDRGTGLGLYLAKEIAENYDGSVEVKDSDMGGARFEVSLKRAS